MRIFILILSIILLALATYAGHWAVSASCIIILVFLILIWGMSERLVLRSFHSITNLQETNFHPIEKKIQEQFKGSHTHKVQVWVTEDNPNFQLYSFGSTKKAHLIFTKSLLSELSPKEILSLSEFTSELISKKFLSKQLLWSSLVIAINKPLKTLDRMISFFSGLKTDNGEPRHILRSLSSWIILSFRGLNRNNISDSKYKKYAKEALKNYSYIKFNHVHKPLKPLSVVDYALK